MKALSANRTPAPKQRTSNPASRRWAGPWILEVGCWAFLTPVAAIPSFVVAALPSQVPPAPLLNLAEYRTVATAITTQAVRSAEAPVNRTGYLGVSLAPDGRGRLMVGDVDAGSPAAQAGVRSGDVLLQVDRNSVKSPEELRAVFQSIAPGTTVKLGVERQRRSLDLPVRLGATSRPFQFSAQRTTLGVRLGELRQGEGAVVQTVMNNSPADQAGVKPGDVIAKLDGETVFNSGHVREILDSKQPGDSVKLVLLHNGEERELEARLSAGTNQTATTLRSPRRSWSNGVYRLAVVLVEYPDVKHNERIATNEWRDFAFSTGTYSNKANATGQRVYGSMNDFYHENSVGAFGLEGRVFDWVEVSRKRADYAQDTNQFNKALLLTESLGALLKREGSDALDGFDGLLFIYAGARVRTANRSGLYWPHRGEFSYGRKRWDYVICPEGGRSMANISMYCHEFGHLLNLPDLYARPENPGSEGLGAWCAMSNDAGGGRPQHFSAWIKERLGWLKPAVLDPTVKQKLILAPVEGSSRECFKVLVRPGGSEYLLLENRRRIGFDRSLPGEGLIIWRVVGGRPILEESHGVEGAAGPRVFPASVPYPSRANNAFTPYTTPSSRSLLGGGLPVHITNIRELAGGRVAFQIGYEFQ